MCGNSVVGHVGGGRTDIKHAFWVEFVGSEYSGALTRIKIMHTGTGRWSAVRVMPAYNAKSRPSGFRHCDMNPRTVGVPPDVVSIVLVPYFCEFLSLRLAHIGFYRIIFMDSRMPVSPPFRSDKSNSITLAQGEAA